MPKGEIPEEVKKIIEKQGVAITDDKGLEMPEYKRTGFKDTDFKMPEDMWKGAMKMAVEFEKMIKEAGLSLEDVPYYKEAAKLDGKEGISREEFAAQLLALSMAKPNNSMTAPFNVSTSFDNDITEDDIEAALKNPERVAAMARQIFGDNTEQGQNDKAQDAKDLNTLQDSAGIRARC